MLTRMKSGMLCSVAKDWSAKYKFQTLITNETIVVKRFFFAFPGLSVAKIKERLHRDARR
jgi:hypothetical protein